MTHDGRGTLYSPRFGDVYASAHGALAQARHVFLGGNGLPQRWDGRDVFTIVETGFGAGLNFLATWQALREAPSAAARLHFVSVEKHPFARADLECIHARYPEVEDLAAQLRLRYPPLIPGFHRLHMDDDRVTLTLLFGDAQPMLHELQAKADAFFLDGFAPAKNPQMWTPQIFAELARLANANATFATYTVAAPVSQGLSAAGFAVEKRPGFARKREMLCGRFTRAVAAGSPPQHKSAIVVGAGLAGTFCAQRLAVRGWNVQLIERQHAPAQEASGVPAGLVRPVFSLDWNTHSRFTSAAFLYAVRHESALASSGHAPIRGEGGVLQLSRDALHFEKQQRIIERFALPPELVQAVGTAQAGELAGSVVAGPGCWFPSAMWAEPASLCQSNLGAAGGLITPSYQREVGSLRHVNDGWEALDGQGRVLANAPVAVLANASMAVHFAQAAWLPLRWVRGQISLMRQRPERNLKIAVCRDGYITPAREGMHCIGASFNEDLPDPNIRREDHEGNLQRLEAMLPGFGESLTPEMLGGRVAFRGMSFDRLPVLGALPQAGSDGDDPNGLFVCAGLGSRGMTWGALAAEIVAGAIAAEPLPIEKSLFAAVDPARFLKRKR